MGSYMALIILVLISRTLKFSGGCGNMHRSMDYFRRGDKIPTKALAYYAESKGITGRVTS